VGARRRSLELFFRPETGDFRSLNYPTFEAIRIAEYHFRAITSADIDGTAVPTDGRLLF
jgi:hypothetical protein